MFSEVDVLGAFVPTLADESGILSSLLARATRPPRSICGVFLRRRTRARREVKESSR